MIMRRGIGVDGIKERRWARKANLSKGRKIRGSKK